MTSWWRLSIYLQWIQPWQVRWLRRQDHRSLAIDGSAFRRDVESLTTPWRLAAWADTHLVEAPDAGWLDPPRAPEVTWARKVGGPPDYAVFAQYVMGEHGFTARLMTVVVPPLGTNSAARAVDTGLDPLLIPAIREPERWHGQVVCAIHDAEAGGWFHFSNWGMFGLYADLDEVAADISPRWVAYLLRDGKGGGREWRRRSESEAPRP